MNMPAKHEKEKKPVICRCSCPYCDVELVVADNPFCEVCKVSFGRCTNCGALIMEELVVVCQSCGKPLK
jgi:prepilin signal peptidase PulO-like enzyme (type II secretory pathway)